MNDRIIELGKKVKMGNMSWQQVADTINKEFGEQLTAEAIRKRFDRMPYKTEDTRPTYQDYSTEYKDGTIEAQKIVEYNKEIFGDKKKLLKYLGYNPEQWEFVYVTTSVWNQHTKEQITKQLYAVKFKLKPIQAELDLDRYVEITKQVFAEEIKPLEYKSNKINGLDKNKMILIPQIEAHLGKLSNEIETGVNYDHHIVAERVEKVFKETIRIQESEQCDKCLLVVGGDFFNSESNSQTTNGTPQQNDTRYKKMFNIGLNLYAQGLLTLKKYFNKIDVKLCVGNHARAMEFFLYIALSCCFKDDDKINFCDDYKDTQSYVFGNVGLFFNHGDANQKRLIASIPAEFYKEYGATKYRYLFVGHLHKLEVINSENGLTLHRVPAICENDNWHYTNRFGIGNIPQHEIIVFDKNVGMLSNNFIYFEENGKKKIKSKRGFL